MKCIFPFDVDGGYPRSWIVDLDDRESPGMSPGRGRRATAYGANRPTSVAGPCAGRATEATAALSACLARGVGLEICGMRSNQAHQDEAPCCVLEHHDLKKQVASVMVCQHQVARDEQPQRGGEF